MPATRLDLILKAAGDPTRLRLLNLLRLGSICLGDLTAALGLLQPTVSRHLALLRHAGLVSDRRTGTRVAYSLVPAATPQVAALHDLLDHCCPEDEVMKTDFDRFRRSVAAGICRLEIIDNTDVS